MQFNVKNGFKIHVSSAWELSEMLQEVRGKCTEVKNKEVPKMAAQVAAFSIDMAKIGRNKDRSNMEMVQMIFNYLATEENKAKGGAAGPGTDWTFNVVLIPKKPSRNPLARDEYLALTFTQQPEFLDIWNGYDNVTDYSYIHNAAPPEGVSQKQWEARWNDWEGAITTPVPKHCGMEYIVCDAGLREMFDESKEAAIDRLLSAMPTFEERLTVLANSVALQHKQKELMRQPRGIITGEVKPRESEQEKRGKAVTEAVKWLESKPKEVDDLRLKYAAKLDKQIKERQLLDKTALIV